MTEAEAAAAIEARMISYCYAVDDIGAMEPLLDHFTADAVFDLSGLGLSAFEGRDAIRGFFAGVFAEMTDHAHYLSNFRLHAQEGERARASAYVIGMGRSRGGTEIVAHVRYDWAARREAGVWRAERFAVVPLLPPPGSIAAVHGR